MSGQTVPVEEKDLDVSIRKLNMNEWTRLTTKATACEEERLNVLNTPIKDTWVKELHELEVKIYGTEMEEETPAVGEKRNIIDLTSE